MENNKEIYREIFIIRPTTTTREAMQIVITQRIADNGEIALSTASLSPLFPVYLEKPDLMEDLGMALIRAAGVMRKLNKKVRNGGR